MNIFNLFKKGKKHKIKEVKPVVKEEHIEIIIENDSGFFENEIEQLMLGGNNLVEIGASENLVDGIITMATMFRGLKYVETKKDENGNVIVILRDGQKNLSLHK